MTMTIPPFPSQDLAKLVLGYLAEEQLMTAYDEFLQASPYLDALQNEYDRIFMTSLKSILAEYRAVKIYVETCKPLLLRKKIFQCTNLLDIVKLLVNYVDLNKIQPQEAPDKQINDKHHSINSNKANTCESCTLLKLTNCVCTSKLKTQQCPNQSSQIDDSSIQNSVEATPLIDLPGNHVTTRKKQIKVLDKDSVYFSDCQNSSASKDSLTNNLCIEDNISSNSIHSSHSNQLRSDVSTVNLNSTVKDIDLAESRKKIEEFDSVLKSVVDKNNTVAGSRSISNQRVSNASTFQDFASGVSVGSSQNSNPHDSSTSESLGIQVPVTKDYIKDNAIGPQLLLQVTHRNNDIELKTQNTPQYTNILAKSDEQKVKILSDVKVANKKKTIKNATSTPLTTTPLMQMQTIVINGTPAYKHTPVANHTFTKDEIMAMPTLIVVPAPGPPQIPTNTNCQPILTQNCKVTTNASSTLQTLSSLVIDLPPNPAVVNKSEGKINLPNLMPVSTEPGLVKTVDFKNASVPKDSATCTSKTPQGLPPVRKSSSTPRRTTHVRVLDFTTPRRILHETINEQVPGQACQAPVEVVLSSSPNISFNNTVVEQNPAVNAMTTVHSTVTAPNADCCDTDTGSSKENTSKPPSLPLKKSNWDSDLRALVAKEANLGCTGKFKKNSRKKKANEKSDKMNKRPPEANATTSKIKKAPKKRRKTVEDEEEEPPSEAVTKPDSSMKPTINIITSTKRDSGEDALLIPEHNKTCENVQNMSNDKDDCIETPEAERLSLQNVIGARLNISDLLETPYKQALYDIQMGTPKFLPDLPGEPLSDIKITNIPTPRFLDTPKPMQATPSSWSSRPTDYSSGGSYYKPDDQDYFPAPDLRCVVSSKEDTTSDKSVENAKDDEKKTRPQRQCTKNVSYYRFASATHKVKETDDTLDTVSTCSDSTGSNDCKNKEKVVKTPRDKSKINKSETKKRVSTKRRKSPTVKEKPKSFIKIKPRQTPTKLTPSRNRKKIGTPGYNSPNKYRRNTVKDKNVDPKSTLVVAAPTKSRRKSSTPRKLHCSKSFNSSSSNTSPEIGENVKPNELREASHTTSQDSDTEQMALRWSDDGSQDTKTNKESPPLLSNECEDIYQIQKYIQNTGLCQSKSISQENHASFQADLMKRGFDVETAKIIERDLLDTSVPTILGTNQASTIPAQIVQPKIKDTPEKSVKVGNNLNIAKQSRTDETDGEEEDEVEFSVYECNEESKNFFSFENDDTKEIPQATPIKLKDKFSMDICIDDDLTVRLRATPFSMLLDQDPIAIETIDYSYKETQMAVSSISNMDRLYTPMKDSYKTQCFEIFDSTLTSLDTPLKAYTPKRVESLNVTTITDIVLEKEKVHNHKETEAMKRKRSSGSDESTSDTKKTKYLLTSASIQNIDIESVLTKLHGP